MENKGIEREMPAHTGAKKLGVTIWLLDEAFQAKVGKGQQELQ